MREELQKGLSDVLEYLMSVTQEKIQPKTAKTRFLDLQKRYPTIQMDLLWEQETYDLSIHYDVLLQMNGEGTVSLSFCSEHSLPWPLRGVRRTREIDLVRVNNTVLTVGDAIAHLDFIWNEIPIINHLVEVCLIREALEKEPIEISDTELQQAMNSFRKAHKLYKAEDTYNWIEQNCITHEKLEQIVQDYAIVNKLRERITANHVEDYFKKHHTDFETAYIAQIDFDDENITQDFYQQICSGKINFYDVAEQRFLISSQNSSVNYFFKIQRAQASPHLKNIMFAAKPGDILEPVKTEKGYAIIRVLSINPACFDEATQTTIKQIIFKQWLAQLQNAATIEWFWG
ncbi:MAG: TIGR04500 family putative peptide maturation system protein [Desmonostoc vinosum HA7617-LM4]|jgi:putative peptide maturation system protein|nr:TIGR04500 family putative peptide maturation system protein [Desmonostoc vinosum HA7617-LM4]